MKATMLILALLLCALMPGVAHGQCQIQTYTNYATSYAIALDSSGNDLISSVVVDGNASMSMQIPCPDSIITQFNNNKQNITHFPYVLNQIGSVGGWTSGPSFCAECYSSYQSDVDSGPANQGDVYNFSWGGEVDCSVAGLIFLVNLIKARQLERAWTKEQSLETESNCHWLSGPLSIMNCNIDSIPHCTPETTPPDMHDSPTEWMVYPISLPLYWWMFAPCERPIDPKTGAPLGPWKCFHGISSPAIDDTLGRCTHNPT